MSRRGVPPISAVDLREHADDDRIQRIWERIENDLGPRKVRATRPERSRIWITLAAATLSAFAGGVWLGQPAQGDDVGRQLAAATDPAAMDVFAAGSEARTYRLPGGGQIRLEPHSVVEIAGADGSSGQNGMLTLRLLRGGATVDASGGRVAGLSMLAGEMRLSTQAGGSWHIRRHDTDVDIRVIGGSVDVTSPDGRRQLRDGQHVSGLPMFSRTALVQAEDDNEVVEPEPLALASADDANDIEEEVETREPEPVPARDWLTLSYDKTSDPNEILLAIQLQYGSVANAVATVQTDRELNALAYLDPTQTMRVNERIVTEFAGSPYAESAAASLASHYERAGQPELAQRYTAMVAQDRFDDDYEACNKLEAMEPETAEAAFAASQYLSKYPTGQCTADAQAIVASAQQRASQTEGGISAPREGSNGQPEAGPPSIPEVPGDSNGQDDGTYDDLSGE